MNPRQILGQIQAEQAAVNGQLCPNCRQFNAKVSQDWAWLRTHNGNVLFLLLFFIDKDGKNPSRF